MFLSSKSQRCFGLAHQIRAARFNGVKSNSRGSLILWAKCFAVSAKSGLSWAKYESLIQADLHRVASSFFRIGLRLPSTTSLSCSFSRGVLTALVFVLHPDSVECVGSARWPNSPPLVRKCAWPALSDREQFGKDCADKNVISKWPCGNRRRTKHEHKQGEMERYDMRTANTLSHACTQCLYATQRKCVRQMCVRHGVSVLLPSHTQQFPLRGCEILRQKIPRLRRSTSILISPTKTLSTNLLSTDHL